MPTRLAILLTLLTLPASGQTTSSKHSWDSSFEKFWKARNQCDFAAARTLAERVWDEVRKAGPAATDYADGVESAYTALASIAGSLPAERIYVDAIAATELPRYRETHLKLLGWFGDHLSSLRQEVKAERILSQAVELDESSPDHSRFLGYALVSLASLKERLGLPADAEKLSPGRQ